jgi:hypothetical protein
VIELMSRSLPPTHKLLVKLYKSDTPNCAAPDLARWARLPLVSPDADSVEFIKGAELVFSIQGTIGRHVAATALQLVTSFVLASLMDFALSMSV